MSVVNFHIGAGKCGSSLIQRLIKDADVRDCLDQQCLPHLSSCLMSYTPCFDFNNTDFQKILHQLKAEIHPTNDVVLSVENMVGIHTHRTPCFGESIKILHYLFKDFDKIRILLYVRRQDDWLEAMYAQDVKRQEKRDFEDYLSSVRFDDLHWLHLADILGSEFELTVLPFEKPVLNTGNIENFAYGFFDWLDAKVIIEDLPVINPSLSAAGTDIQMLANRTLSEEQAYQLSFWLEKHTPKAPGDKFALMKDRQSILDKYRDTNALLFERWMKGFDPSYYLE